ncbi:MAG: hypothetical protein V1708_02870 [Candidatus Micrarchaeota archaeon]
MNVNLGAPYELIIKRVIDNGYAGSQTEVIRQALLSYDREIEEEVLVRRGIEAGMELIKAGKVKTHSLKKVLKEAGLE